MRPVPKSWFGNLDGKRVLCLASGGGQHAPILAAAGASVVSFDLSDVQLEFGHLLESPIGGQIGAGFVIADLYEGYWTDEIVLNKYSPLTLQLAQLKRRVRQLTVHNNQIKKEAQLF